ncbi:MAG TPA: long-chain fatty acid--CoA ligase [Candidatus Rokubacteria bacterium]|nr:long-chain fatty acid--CoA ligase [Candidatus Rokubacteria bacterium]HBH03780.1 long-chain fatty acid--CoA ligase [Candidatus Rokubacteria bacterium]
MSTVFAAFERTAAAHPEHAFLCAPPAPARASHPEGVELSYRAVRDEVLALRERYRAAGYGHGHRVALLLENRPEFFFHYLALNALGAGIVPVNPDYRHDEMLYQMDHSEANLAVVVGARVGDLERVARARPRPLPVLDAGALPERLPAPGSPPRAGAPGLDTECGLLYTSGTTGRPKGCILTNRYYLTAGAWYRDMGGLFAFEPGRERIYNPLPLFHMNCQAVTATCVILTAGCLILPERFSPARWWPDVVATRATIVHYLGVVPPMLLNQPPAPEERRHGIKFGLGAGVEPELHAPFERRFGFPLVECWGMTETGRIFGDRFEPRRISTRAFGRPHGGFEARVVDEQDREVPRGTEGEMLVRWGGPEGPRDGFFAEYLKNAEATEEAWRGGWFHTGDVVRQEADGMLVFVDRKKNIIRRSGENIAAAEVEAALQAHDAVAQVAVLAVPDEVREEEVMACVVPMPGAAADRALAQGLQDWCLARLAYFKAPGFILFVESLPTTGTQKVQKAQIFPKGEDPRARPGVLDLRDRKRRR